MEFINFTAGQNDAGRRLDRVLRKFLADVKLSEIYKLLRKGLIKLNNTKAKPETHINDGDIISIAAFLLENENLNNQNQQDEKTIKIEKSNLDNVQNNGYTSSDKKTSLDIVFENEHLLIINKPYDRSVHGKKDGIYKDVLAYYEEHCTTSSSSLSFKPGPLHRLDRRTTGLLVFSKSLTGAKWFSEGIQQHIIQKSYYAILTGMLESQTTWEDYIIDTENDSKSSFHKVQASSKAGAAGDKAITIAVPVSYGVYKGKDVTLSRLEIKTGRKHQIRCQSALHSFPLLGDTAYGAKALSANKEVNPGGREFYLQAYSLRFPHNNPLSLPDEIKIGLSPDFLCQLECCEIKNPGL